MRLGGEDVTRLGPHQRCRRGIARTFQLARPFPELSALANVALVLGLALSAGVHAEITSSCGMPSPGEDGEGDGEAPLRPLELR